MRSLARRFWGSLILLVLVLAVAVQLGREAFPLLNDYREPLADYFSDALGVDVNIGAIEAQWVGLRPRLQFSDVTMHAEDGQQILQMAQVEGELSLMGSLRQWQLVWRNLAFDDLTVAFDQDDGGRWTLGGLRLARPGKDDHRELMDPLDIFLSARHITLTDSTFLFSFRTGHRAEITAPELTVENESDFHRARAQLAVDDDAEAVTVIVEGHGDARSEDDFAVNGYLALESFPLEKVVAALDIASWDAAAEGQWSEGHRLDTQLWFAGNPYQSLQLKGRLRSDGLPIRAPDNVELPVSLTTQLTGGWQAGEGWQLALQEAQVLWQEFAAPTFNLVLSGAYNRPLRARMDRLDLSSWRSLLARVGLTRGRLTEVVETLAPEGELTHVEIEQRAPEDGHFRLRANMQDVKLSAYRGAPAIEQLDGYLEATSKRGRVTINSRDGFSMFFPQVYRDPLVYQRASGEIRWAVRADRNEVEVRSGRLRLAGDEGEGRGYVRLLLPLPGNPGVPELSLLVGLRDSSVSFREKYVPYKIPANLYQWLEQSVEAGSISEAGFLWHGPLVRDRPATNSAVQLFGYVEDAALAYSPDWPKAESVNGLIVLDDAELDVAVDRAQLAGMALDQVTVKLDPASTGGLRLDITGRSRTELNRGLDFLRNSPIAALLGDALNDWEGSGRISAQLDLEVPLQKEAGAGSYEVKLDLQGAQLALTDLGLTLHELSGPVSYTSTGGLTSDSIAFTLWDQPAQAQIRSRFVDGQHADVQIQLQAAASTRQLSAWLEQPQLNKILSGQMAVNGQVGVPVNRQLSSLNGVEIQLTSNLQGVSIELPMPYGKDPDSERSFSVDLQVTDERVVRLAYGNLVYGQFEWNGYLRGASVVFGSDYGAVEPGYLDVSGRVGEMEVAAWRDLWLRLSQTGSGPAPGTGAEGAEFQLAAQLTPRFDLHMAALKLEELNLEQLYISGEHMFERWHVDVRSPYLSGEVYVFDDGRPLQVELTSVRLPAANPVSDSSAALQGAGASANEKVLVEEEPSDPVGLLKGLDLSRLPAMNFSAGSITSAGTDYGAWTFRLRPIEGGITLKNLRGDVFGLNFSGIDPEDEGAEMVWLQSQQRNSTYVRGRVTTSDLETVLRQLGQAELLESESARFDVELNWPGAPDEPRLEQIGGSVGLTIRNGRFIRGADAGNNPFLRLFGLLNFDTMARRLQLDFSDLYKEGLVFDAVAGTLEFRQGQVLVNRPLRVESPSTTLQFAGVLDASSEQLDASLVATLPMSGNLAIAAAFVGGLPAAVGVYAASKLFKEQVDRVSSIRYRITGSWAEPRVRVDRIFESSTEAERALLQQTPAPSSAGDSSAKPRAGTGDFYRDSNTGEPELEGRRPPQP